MINQDIINEALEHATYDIPERTQQLLVILAEAAVKQVPKKPAIKITGTTGWSTKLFCPVCGTEISDSNKYCWECGKKLDGGQEDGNM